MIYQEWSYVTSLYSTLANWMLLALPSLNYKFSSTPILHAFIGLTLFMNCRIYKIQIGKSYLAGYSLWSDLDCSQLCLPLCTVH
ncbi:hypothetical protein L873DRAFT_1822910 [Choiromyces venosus 120613-1]|uniref:Uncharacterized protein n=1 Tax=Choiromyces venosus 120613-1 TaxID=1336337 RepID=A0A3N4IWR6_9PEZI|nr:hypothetical protein L873DRAFT_1822910 [Choiromyces venosus 120613-1]